MPIRQRKLLGSFLLLLWMLVYSILAVNVAENWLPDSQIARLIFYPVAGVLWVFPVRPLVFWMRG
ncbi:MAG: DUF2842 domain-containing protein [Alphaproteobacteria bacterium]|nr:DUF2842 domain-containing protein [Alphaproteobacteria bacterium]